MEAKRTIENMHHTVYELVIPEELRTVEAYRYIGVHSSNVAFLDDNYWGSGEALKGMGMKDIAERFVLKTFATRKEAEAYETLMQKKVDAASSLDYFNRINSPVCQGGRQGMPTSAETKEKLRIANLGKKATPETKKKLRIANLGRKNGPRTPETKKKLRIANLGRKHSLETKEKCRLANLGRKHTPEAKEKIRLANLGKKRTPEQVENNRRAQTGKKHTPETREKLRKLETEAEAFRANNPEYTHNQAKSIVAKLEEEK